jgi:hypothetical protein
MQKGVSSYMEQRLEALAVIHLTRRKDLVVTKSELDMGVDLLVHLVRENEASRKTFGVILRGTTERLASEVQATKKLNSLAKGRNGVQLSMPVCVFLFSMQEMEGYYDWQAEPSVEGGKARLVPHERFTARTLDPAAVDGIVESIDHWYDALFASVIR